MSLLTNPVLVSVVVLCVLCLLKLNVLMSLIIAAMTGAVLGGCLLYTSPSPRDRQKSRMPSSA